VIRSSLLWDCRGRFAAAMSPANSVHFVDLKIFLAVISVGLISSLPADAANPPQAIERSRQCIVVVTNSWAGPGGTAWWFERSDNGQWQRRGGPANVVVGRAGLAWGRGEIKPPELIGPVKREGDDKAPAGVFQLGTAFGYAAKPIPTKMPYLALSKNIVGVDDPQSRYYNRLVDVTRINQPDWRSAENMILGDQRYKLGLVVLHNEPPKSGAGSCIFLHVWLNRSTSTSGCTAMAEPNIRRLLGWLDPAKAPLLIQLTRAVYNEVQARWDLPNL
jgi:D-alanyl-D-alanine dipeptidase